jgi:hypothetical protein
MSLPLSAHINRGDVLAKRRVLLQDWAAFCTRNKLRCAVVPLKGSFLR